MRKTTQRAARVEVDNLNRIFQTRKPQKGITMLPKGTWSDTLFFDTTYLLGKKYTQMFFSPPRFVNNFCMKTNGEAGNVLRNFINTWETPQLLRADQSK